jgi:uridine phosphorylase
MGGPSAAIVIEELVMLGAHAMIRIGTCGAIDRGLEIGQLVAVERALAEDGASAALGASGEVEPDRDLTAALREACGGLAVTAVSSDLFYDRREAVERTWAARGAAVVEMEAATLFQAARVHGVRAACVLGVTDLLGGGRQRIGQEELAELGLRLGEAGFAALASCSS